MKLEKLWRGDHFSVPSIEDKPPIPRMFCENPNCFLHKAFIGNPNTVTVERFDAHMLSDIRTDVRRTACMLSHFSGMTVILCDYCMADAKAGKLKWTEKFLKGKGLECEVI